MLRRRNTEVLERMQMMADRNVFSDDESDDEDSQSEKSTMYT